jgi:hypothetical protein
MRLMTYFLLLLLLLFSGPFILLLKGEVKLGDDYKTANRASANIAPLPEQAPEALIQIYTARAFNWHGLFSLHTWIATKAAHAKQYTVYQVVGWRLFYGMPPLDISHDVPDRYWYNQKPHLLLEIKGEQAQALIPKIEEIASKYPYPNNYTLWPGPNSNTFTAYVIRMLPELSIAFPSNAIGKDFLPGKIFSRSLSGTGYQFSLYGIFGITVAIKEGIEINFLGLVFGINPWQLSIKLPGLGELSALDHSGSGNHKDSPLS